MRLTSILGVNNFLEFNYLASAPQLTSLIYLYLIFVQHHLPRIFDLWQFDNSLYCFYPCRQLFIYQLASKPTS